MSARALLRPGLLDGCVVVVAAAADGPFGAAVEEALSGLGATVERLRPEDPLDEAMVEAAVSAVLERHGRIDLLVGDGAAPFDREGDGGIEPFHEALDAAWLATRAVAGAAYIPSGDGGTVLHVAPAPDAGPHASAARAAFENLARTLSIEWSRFGICTVTIAPGPVTTAEEVATLLAYLASPAGGYFSGCVLSMGEVAPSAHGTSTESS